MTQNPNFVHPEELLLLVQTTHKYSTRLEIENKNYMTSYFTSHFVKSMFRR